MVGDELDHRGDVLRRSSSAWATYANAFRRISFARFSSRTSRSSSFNRSRSLVVRPGRCPASRCACRTHVRRVSAVQPSFGATDCSTAHSEAWASRCSSTIRTARSRTSGENRLGRPIDPILPSNEVSEKPGTVHVAALVLIVEPGRQHRLDPGLVGRTLGLTPGESQVAVGLAAGKSVRDMALTTGLTEGAIYWHLKQIYQKLPISRQVDLVRLVLSIAEFG